MKLTREDKIMLMFGEKRKHLNFSEIDGDKKKNELAVIRLRTIGYVAAHENGSSRHDRFITISITDSGILRKEELERLLSRPIHTECWEAITDGWRKIHPSVGRIVEGIIIAVVSAIISGAVCFWLGRITAPNIPDEAADNYKQEHSDNMTIRLD